MTITFSQEENMNSKKLYVGGLPYSVTEGTLQEIFAAHGTVESAVVISDRMTGRSKGFGFVEMSSQEEAQAAIDKLNGTDLEGRNITVNEAKPREPRTGGGGGGGDGGGGGGGGGERWESLISRALRGALGRFAPLKCSYSARWIYSHIPMSCLPVSPEADTLLLR